MAGARSSSRRLADRYTSAIFALSEGKEKTLDAFDAFFSSLESLLSGDEGLMDAFSNPTASRRAKEACTQQ